MLRLIETNPAPTWKLYFGNRTPPDFLHIRTADAFLSEGCHLGLQIFAHEVEFMYVVRVGRMERGLCRRHRKDQPTVAGVDGLKSKDIPKKGAICFRVLAVDDHMSARDHESSPQRINHEETKSTKGFSDLFFAPFVSSWFNYISAASTA
jgi:hypothetical protein